MFFIIYYIRPVIQLRLNNERAFTVVTLRKWRVRLDFIIIKTDSFELFSSSAYKEWRDDEHTMTKHITPDKRFLRFFTFFFALLDVYDECRVKVSNISSSRETRKIIITCSSLLFFNSTLPQNFQTGPLKRLSPLKNSRQRFFNKIRLYFWGYD